MNPYKALVSLVIIFLPFFVFAQSSFKAGYVVTNGDTLHGYLKQDVESKLINGVGFSNNANGTDVKFYSPDNMTAFAFDNENLYQLIHFSFFNDKADYFVKYLLKGYYNLYSFRKDETQYFLIGNSDSVYFLYDDKIMPNGDIAIKGNFRNQLLYLSINCKSTSQSLDALKFDEKDLIAYTQKLNACIHPETVSTSLYKKSKSELHFFVFAGGIPLGKSYEYTGRAGVRFSSPSISKTVFLNVTLSYLAKTFYQDGNSKQRFQTDVISGGLTLQNNFTKGVIQPYIEAGFGFANEKDKGNYRYVAKGLSKSYGIDLIGGAGIEGYITKSLVVKADWRYEIIAHYPVIGVTYFF